MPDSSPQSERPLHDYIDMEAYDVVSGKTYRNLLEQLAIAETERADFEASQARLLEQLATAETERDDFEASQARLLEQLEEQRRHLAVVLDEKLVTEVAFWELKEQLETLRTAAQAYRDAEAECDRTGEWEPAREAAVVLDSILASSPANDLGTSSAGNEDVPNPAKEPDA